MTTSIRIDRDVAIELRGGTMTVADIYRPAGRGRHPVLLQRTPYNRAQLFHLGLLNPLRAAARGYVVVIEDVRGRYASDGNFTPFFQETIDGYDSVEWCASQLWSDGNVGMIGASYIGATQWLAAVTAPPHLRCIVPMQTSSDFYEGWVYRSGALQWGFLVSWIPMWLAAEALTRNITGPRFEQIKSDLTRRIDDLPTLWNTLPLRELPFMSELAPYFLEWLDHPERDSYWRNISIVEQHPSVTVPAFNMSGWYDMFRDGTIENFVGLTAHGSTIESRTGNRLLLGPWDHSAPTVSSVGSEDFGLASSQHPSPLSYDQEEEYFRFLDRWLKGIETELWDGAAVKLFVMGANTWRLETAWPLERSHLTPFFLHSSGTANSRCGEGSLSTTEPAGEPPDFFIYNPRNPVPTLGGQLCCYPEQLPWGVFDQTPVERRQDVLVYVTESLQRDIEITGPIVLELWASTNAVDTDFTAKLVDIEPSGRARNLTDGVVRCRYRHGTDKAVPVEPEKPMLLKLDLGATSNLFRSGHRIGLEIASSNFPRFDRNLNTGHPIGGDAELRVALQTVYHSADSPSCLLLPVVPQ